RGGRRPGSGQRRNPAGHGASMPAGCGRLQSLDRPAHPNGPPGSDGGGPAVTRTLILLAVAAAALLPAGPVRASLYQPDDPMAVPVRPDGTADPLPFDEFQRRMAVLANTANPTLKTRDRERVQERV